MFAMTTSRLLVGTRRCEPNDLELRWTLIGLCAMGLCEKGLRVEDCRVGRVFMGEEPHGL